MTLALAFAGPALAAETWVSAGVGRSGDGLDAWQAVSCAPLGRFDEPGVRLSALGAGEQTATVAAGWIIGDRHLGGEIMAGLAMRDRGASQIALSPALSPAIDWAGETGGLSALTIAHPAFAETWLELRPWIDVEDGWKIGGMLGLSFDPEPQGLRVGIFTGGYRVALPIVKEVFIGGETGLDADLPAVTVRPYVSINLGLGF